MKNAIIEKLCETRTRYTFTDKCAIGGQLIVDVTESRPDNKRWNSLPNLWCRAGRTTRILGSYWSLTVYAHDADGHCFGMFNPQHDRDKIDFAWMLEATPKNLEKLLEKVCELAHI